MREKRSVHKLKNTKQTQSKNKVFEAMSSVLEQVREKVYYNSEKLSLSFNQNNSINQNDHEHSQSDLRCSLQIYAGR
jgi:hypothetical protein